MAASVVNAELLFRDGRSQKMSVKVENNLSSLIKGINNLNANVSQLLSELVEQEKAHGAMGEEDEDDDDDDDDDRKDPQNSEHQPPAKKSRT